MLYGVSQVDNAIGCLYFFGKFRWCFLEITSGWSWFGYVGSHVR